MKTCIYYRWSLFLILIAVGMQSCIIGEINDENPYASHQLVYNYSDLAMYEQLYTLDMVAKVSEYANANSAYRDSLSRSYFSNSEINENNGIWTVKDSVGVWNISGNNIPLGLTGAAWSVGLIKSNGTGIEQGEFQVICNSTKTWKITVDSIQLGFSNRLKQLADYDDYFTFHSSGNYVVSVSSPDSLQPLLNNYTIESGNGSFVPDKKLEDHYNVDVNFTIKSPVSLRYNSSSYLFSAGSIYYDVISGSGNTIESFTAKLHTTPSNWNVTFE
ncbi:MAG: hypothetical protein QM654_09055 [Dysgonamonadaceae bacterium]